MINDPAIFANSKPFELAMGLLLNSAWWSSPYLAMAVLIVAFGGAS